MGGAVPVNEEPLIMAEFRSPYKGDNYKQGQAIYLPVGFCVLSGLCTAVALMMAAPGINASHQSRVERERQHEANLEALDDQAEFNEAARDKGLYVESTDLTVNGFIHGVHDPLTLRQIVSYAYLDRLAPGTVQRMVTVNGTCLGFATRKQLYLYIDYPDLCPDYDSDYFATIELLKGASYGQPVRN